jgi:hypothetical protein
MEFTKAVKRATTKTEKIFQTKPNCFQGLLNNNIITFYKNGPEPNAEATCFNVRRVGDEHDSMTDYSAGTFLDNLGQSIKWALKN